MEKENKISIIEQIQEKLDRVKALSELPKCIIISHITERRIYLDNELPKNQSVEDKFNLPVILNQLARETIIIGI